MSGDGDARHRTDGQEKVHFTDANAVLEQFRRGDLSQREKRTRFDQLAQTADTAAICAAALSASTTASTRAVLSDVLGAKKDPQSLNALLTLVADPDIDVRANAADAIGKVFGYVPRPPVEQRGPTLAALVARWQVEESPEVRSTLAQTLALVGDPVVKPLLEAVLDDEDRRVRGQARWGLDYLNRVGRV